MHVCVENADCFMDILIPHSWLKDYLKTDAKPEKIAQCLSLSGPSVERVIKSGTESVYSIEVTSNRVDCLSVCGIAREAACILPRFKIPARFIPPKQFSNPDSTTDNLPLTVLSKTANVRRVMAIVIDGVEAKKSPPWLKQRLEHAGLRSLNLLIDITNYVMLDTGHPTHVFDYDRIKSHTLIFRESQKGEKIKTLEHKDYVLPGGDIVIDDCDGEIIDLPGIIGTANSVVTPNTKRIIFFIDNNNPVQLRKTSLNLGIRTLAAVINEKDVDPELAGCAFAKGVQLYKEIAKGKIASKVIDIYQNPNQGKTVKTNLDFVKEIMGTDINKTEITKILKPLGFSTKWTKNNLEASVPSWRSRDINIPEDIVEEAARIYGYHNLPSRIMPGTIPNPLANTPFGFEKKIKEILRGWGGIEVYTYSMVARDKVDISGASSWVLKLKNPLGKDSEYMRLSLANSLVDTVIANKGDKSPFHLFEMGNVYLPTRGNLPEERMMLAGIFSSYSFEKAKGIVEGLISVLRAKIHLVPQNSKGFSAQTRLEVKSGRETIGQFGILEKSGNFYYEFDAEALRAASHLYPSFTPLPKYPPQVEDLALRIPDRVFLGLVVKKIYKTDSQIVSVELLDTYQDTRTFRISYQNPDKTLTNKEVEELRKKILANLKKKFEIRAKD